MLVHEHEHPFISCIKLIHISLIDLKIRKIKLRKEMSG